MSSPISRLRPVSRLHIGGQSPHEDLDFDQLAKLSKWEQARTASVNARVLVKYSCQVQVGANLTVPEFTALGAPLDDRRPMCQRVANVGDQ